MSILVESDCTSDGSHARISIAGVHCRLCHPTTISSWPTHPGFRIILTHTPTIMDEHDYEMEDDDAYEGPDAYIEDDDNDDEIEYDIEDAVEELVQPHDDGSVQGLLQCEYQQSSQFMHYLEYLFSTIRYAKW